MHKVFFECRFVGVLCFDLASRKQTEIDQFFLDHLFGFFLPVFWLLAGNQAFDALAQHTENGVVDLLLASASG